MKIIDIIEWKGNNHTFVWKYPGEDFNTLSKLIVHESQEALLFLGGQACDLFGPGEYTLHTKNIPLLNKIINLPTGGESPFKCEVYFINKTEQMAIPWGMGDVLFRDPVYNDYPFTIGAHGEMSIRLDNSRKVITKLVGTEILDATGVMFDQEKLKNYFKAPINTLAKTLLPNIFRSKQISIFELEEYLSEVSELLRAEISKEMDDYGIVLEKFWINAILKPETDQIYIDLRRQRGEKITLANQGELDAQRAENLRRVSVIEHTGVAQKERIDVDTQRYKQEQLGITYIQERGFDVMEKIAGNECK